MIQTIVFDLSDLQPYALSCQHLDSGNTEAGPLDSPSKKPEC